MKFKYDPPDLSQDLYNLAILTLQDFPPSEIMEIENISRHEYFRRHDSMLSALDIESESDLSEVQVEEAHRPHLNGFPLPSLLCPLSECELKVVLLKAMEWESDTIAKYLSVNVNDVDQAFCNAACKAGYSDPYHFLYRVRCTGIVGDPHDDEAFSVLSDAERDVAILTARGKNCYEVASYMEKSYRTVKNQLTSVYQKLGIGGQNDLMVLAIDAGIVNIGELAIQIRRGRNFAKGHFLQPNP